MSAANHTRKAVPKHESAPESCGMDGLENGHVEGILPMNESEHAADTSTKKKQEWEAGDSCR